METYREELSGMLDVPVEATAIPADRRLPETDLLVRRGADHRLRGGLFDDGEPFARAAGTTITVYPRESRRPPFVRRLLERFVL
jgi:hypothetical protein